MFSFRTARAARGGKTGSVASARVRDLVVRAKHLLVAAKACFIRDGRRRSRSRRNGSRRPAHHAAAGPAAAGVRTLWLVGRPLRRPPCVGPSSDLPRPFAGPSLSAGIEPEAIPGTDTQRADARRTRVSSAFVAPTLSANPSFRNCSPEMWGQGEAGCWGTSPRRPLYYPAGKAETFSRCSISPRLCTFGQSHDFHETAKHWRFGHRIIECHFLG